MLAPWFHVCKRIVRTKQERLWKDSTCCPARTDSCMKSAADEALSHSSTCSPKSGPQKTTSSLFVGCKLNKRVFCSILNQIKSSFFLCVVGLLTVRSVCFLLCTHSTFLLCVHMAGADRCICLLAAGQEISLCGALFPQNICLSALESPATSHYEIIHLPIKPTLF